MKLVGKKSQRCTISESDVGRAREETRLGEQGMAEKEKERKEGT